MGKFSVGGIGNAIKSSSYGAKASKIMSDVQNTLGNNPEKVMSIMDKLTPGNVTKSVAGKIGVNIDGSKIDGILDRYYEAKSNIRSTIINSILAAAEKAGYNISLPNEESITNYIMSSGIMDKIESMGDQINNEGIQNVVNSIDIHKAANDIGFSIKKVEKPFETKEEAFTAIGGVASVTKDSLKNVGSPIKDGVGDIANEITDSFDDMKDILNNQGE